ncbi:helix-turn-helix transcriptional regulator [Bacillus tianshenii]|nr:helix-turn-helix transcriptional regulator [Bacillus tianshenii]
MSFAKRYAQQRSERDPEFQQEWKSSTLERQLAAQLIELRLNLGLTQSQFGELVGMKQSVISRLENGEQNITLNTLQEIIQKAGARVSIDISLSEPPMITTT